MTEEQALLRCIIATPADDLPRLVYADFLDETGEPERAEFIRIGCFTRGAPVRPGTGEIGLRDWERRQNALWDCHSRKWLPVTGEVRPFLGGPEDLPRHSPRRPWVLVRRGFPASVQCDLATWERHGAALVAAYPLEVVRLTDDRLYRSGHYLDGTPVCSLEPNHLPGDVWEVFHRGDNYSSRYELWVYPDRESAASALGLACLNVERRKLGLPLLLPAPAPPAPAAEGAPL